MHVCGSSDFSGRSEWVTDEYGWGGQVKNWFVNQVTSQSVNMVCGCTIITVYDHFLLFPRV